jgi:hypothetical protein
VNKEELKALCQRLNDYLKALVTNAPEIMDLTWREITINNVLVQKKIIDLMLEDEDKDLK